MIALGSLGLRFSFPTRCSRWNAILRASSIPNSVSRKLYSFPSVLVRALLTDSIKAKIFPALVYFIIQKLQFQFAMILLSFFLKTSRLDFPSSMSLFRLLTLFFSSLISLEAVFKSFLICATSFSKVLTVAFILLTEFWSNLIYKVMPSSLVNLANILEAKFCAMCSAVKTTSLCSASASSRIIRISKTSCKSSSSCFSFLRLNSGKLLLQSLLLFLLLQLIKDSNSI